MRLSDYTAERLKRCLSLADTTKQVPLASSTDWTLYRIVGLRNADLDLVLPELDTDTLEHAGYTSQETSDLVRYFHGSRKAMILGTKQRRRSCRCW